MYEKRKHPLLSRTAFIARLVRHFLAAAVFVPLIHRLPHRSHLD